MWKRDLLAEADAQVQADSARLYSEGESEYGALTLDVRAKADAEHNLQAALERLLAHGATLVHPPVQTPWGDYNVRLQDPDGMQITLFQELESLAERTRRDGFGTGAQFTSLDESPGKRARHVR